ncbi:capsular biosynthesis protein [Campylobacter sp. MIT 99-7217]|uniref:glycosyltransferase family 2 protein n=1 Tax=Campylobacter sp. MIT 99-7217 TaxID=535091 RepID=UPI001157337E|nr:glycosyltransferase family 2 protein [Campylobacter sp. MIT 99-7217]TQR34593.1 capsular biosynthesis protein [Campylobacter sp. MIT 99-7217]
MLIIFPMAGLSSRFLKAGYKEPKYMLELKGKSLFARAVSSFKQYFDKFDFLFIYRNLQDSESFIKKECEGLNLKRFEMIELEKPTLGQAHTCFLGLLKAKIKDDESLLIFNIDSFYLDFSLPKELDIIDGYLEVFKGKGQQWSFVKTLPNSNRVIQTAEKEPISKLCSTGLYYFKKASDFKEVFLQMQKANDKSKNEFYIAPMYNYLITQNKDIRAFEIDIKKLVFCGLPSEYEELLKDESFK